jgi:Flp pilus assembly secretin CpaC
MPRSPLSLLGAAGVQAGDAAIVCAASALAGVDAAAGKSYQLASGIALTLIGLGTAAALAVIAAGLARGRRWSRTPALLTQLFIGIVGIYLVQGHRYAWGVPLLVLAVAGFAAVLAPPSLRAMAGERSAPADPPGTRP